MELPDVDILLFDVFGTVVDWRSSIVSRLAKFEPVVSAGLDPEELADAWRGAYVPMMQKVASGELPWTNLDGLHRMGLESLLRERGVGAGAEALDEAALFWHGLEPWPDAVEGLTRLKRRYVVATLSNGNVALLLDMAKAAGLPWDTILSAELARKYKLDPDCYRYNAGLLGRPLDRVMMVAAHAGDLERARGVGLRTAFVERPLEHGPPGRVDTPAFPTDLACRDFLELADSLGT